MVEARPGVLVGKGRVSFRDGRRLLGKQQGMFIDRHEVGQPNEFANWTDEELRAFIKSGTRPLGIVSGKTQH